MNTTEYAWDGRQEYVKILADLFRQFYSCSYENPKAWLEAAQDLFTHITCLINRDKEEEIIKDLKGIDSLIFIVKSIEKERKLDLLEANEKLRKLGRDFNRVVYDAGMWGAVTKRVDPNRAIEDIF